MITRRHLTWSSFLLAHISAAAPAPALILQTQTTSSALTVATSAPANLNSSLSAVCIPTECIQGVNSLAAGATVFSPVNSSTRATILLPGTYTSSSSVTANTSLLSFPSTSSITASSGFSTSGTFSSTFTVILKTGMTTYPSPLFEGTPAYIPLATTASLNSTSTTDQIESFLISDNTWAILQLGGSSGSRIVAWDGVADVGNLPGGGGGSGGVSVLQIQSAGCTTPCASGGVCAANSTCVCQTGFTGPTCNACAPGFFGRACIACPVGCTACDAGITGTGRCLTPIVTNATALECNCINGVCASNSSTATCGCNAGWGRAANGTQCAACAEGYFPSASGDCLACDASCTSCSGPAGTCLTCQTGRQPLSTDATKCTTATTATTNGTFITCPDRTFFDQTTSACVDCNPLCETCFGSSVDSCLTCRTPNVLLNGVCVAMDSSTGVCDSAGVNSTFGANAQWVFDNQKNECDAIPAKCAAASINDFTSASTRAQIQCTSCLVGTFLFDGNCVATCPSGTTVSTDGTSCVACDSTCATCTGTATFCTTCSSTTQLTLNGTCIAGPSCPVGFFSPSGNSTCLSCHPDCLTCGTTFDTCLTCPSTRPVLSSTNTCLETCSSNEYFDTSKGACVTCSSECQTCSGAGGDDCLSCSSTTTLKQGACVAADCTVITGFGVCLSSLVTASAVSVAAETKSKVVLPWWTILLIVVGSLALIGIGLAIFRRKEQKRRRLQTARFANDLGQKEVDMKLDALPRHVRNPARPRAEESEDDVPLTPRFVVEAHGDVEAIGGGFRGGGPHLDKAASRWSGSSYASKATQVKPLVKQETGTSELSTYSQRSLVSASGKRIDWGSKNPFIERM